MLGASNLPVVESERAGLTTSRSAQASYRRSYPQTSKAVGLARRDVIDVAKACGFSGQALADIEVAVGEGLANAVEHGRRGDGGFEVWVRCDEFALVIEIKDSGRGFDHGSVCSRTRPPVEALRGFGTFIMRELMDEIHYTEFGTRLRLLKRLPSATSHERTAMRA
jgi:anti-sigma regulatory factor (Ser/Thr protein kinase)